MLAAALLALCVGCSSSSSNGQAICGPCPMPVTVTVSGLDQVTAEGVRMHLCVGEMPCTSFRLTRRDETVSCGSVACSLDETGSTRMLHLTLAQKDARKVADLPVRVTASTRKEQRQGEATMTYVHQGEPCGCNYSRADIALM
ncbi:hypothetical protein D0T12_00775 [Actinomadura spongiicola]|uniref:Lipoprotein n=1 Tax=Actinomadura spongiicola TaxID=2303421 RepID=A0A372GN78_9ACTN|nr:hypothetical protein [Actinomadura spongiicola]RFS86851.1 hypothetical protein D0T12_00775 [Actinomadura spongiicola]